MRWRTTPSPVPVLPRLGQALAFLAAIGLCACSSPAVPVITPVTTANLLIVSDSTSGYLPDAVVNVPYGYGFQTNIGQTGVTALAPITFEQNTTLPPGMTLSSGGVLSGAPTQAGSFSVVVNAVDSSPSPQTASFTYILKVNLPGATLTQVAHNNLGGQGQNADVSVATATKTGVAYAYVGTRGTPGSCPATGVRVVSLSQITNPQVVATVGGVSGASQQEPRIVTGVSSPSFHFGSTGDLMAVTEQPCNSNSATSNEEGIQFIDVTDPTHPVLLGSWNSGVDGVGDVAFVPVPGPANAQGVVDHTQDKIYALAAVPNSETTAGSTEGDLRVLDVTNPAVPSEIANWGVLAATDSLLPQVTLGQDQRVFLDTIQLSSDRKTAYLGYWDEGVVVLNVSDPTVIGSNNANILLNHITYPVNTVATSTTPSSPEGNTHEALPVANNTDLLITDSVCASMFTSSPANPTQMTATNPAPGIVCGPEDGPQNVVNLNQNAGWGFLRTYALPTPGTSTMDSFYATAESESAPPPDNGIYTAHNMAWNGNTVDPHAYVAWYSDGIVDLDLTSINPPTHLASFVPPATPDPNGNNPAVNNPDTPLVFGVAAYNVNGQPYILASDINSGLWVVAETPTTGITILTTTVPDGNVGVPYTANLTAVNGSLGSSQINFSVQSNSYPLPSGLELDPSGAITGTPTATGTVDVTFVADDGAGNETQQTIDFTINQNLAITPVTPPPATFREPYTLALTAVNGVSPYTWSVVNSNLPTGLSISPTSGEITGTPASNGTTTATIQVSDSSTPPLTATMPITIQVEPLTLASPLLPIATVGAAYSDTVTIANGAGPFVPVVISGTLPPGITVTNVNAAESGFLIQGTPTTPGTYAFSVEVTDADGSSITAPLTLVVDPYEITPAYLLAGEEGHGYSLTLNAKGGVSPYTFSLITGPLPPGLTMDTAGDITGVPASGSAGSYSLTIEAIDTNGLTATQNYTLVIYTGNTFAITTIGVFPSEAGQNYSQLITADFGTTPYIFTLLNGTLPSGVTLSPNGTLAGVPAVGSASGYAFTVQATDANGNKATAHFNLAVLPPLSPN